VSRVFSLRPLPQQMQQQQVWPDGRARELFRAEGSRKRCQDPGCCFGDVCTRGAAATQVWLRDIPWKDALLRRRLSSRDAGTWQSPSNSSRKTIGSGCATTVGEFAPNARRAQPYASTNKLVARKPEHIGGASRANRSAAERGPEQRLAPSRSKSLRRSAIMLGPSGMPRPARPVPIVRCRPAARAHRGDPD
jgi:hypothetical protein